MPEQITSLSPGQAERLGEFRDKWLAVGLSTAPTDRARAEAGVARAYAAAKMAPPALRIWLRSPIEGVLGAEYLRLLAEKKLLPDQVRAQVRDQVRAQVWDQVGAQVGAQVWDQVRDQVWDQVRAQVRDQVGAQVWDQVWAQVGRCGYGLHDASWLGFYNFFEEVCGLKSVVTPLHGLMEIAETTGWWWPFAGAVILTEKPHTLRRDEQGRLHCETGPAIQYADGWGIWAIHGVRVPAQVVEAPHELTFGQIRGETNAEVRRVMLDRFGKDRYIRESGAVVVHRDDWGTLYRVEFPDDEPLVMVEVVNSTPEPDGTFKDYWLRVQPELRPMVTKADGTVELGEAQELTALNAVASTFGFTGAQYARDLVQQT